MSKFSNRFSIIHRFKFLRPTTISPKQFVEKQKQKKKPNRRRIPTYHACIVLRSEKEQKACFNFILILIIANDKLRSGGLIRVFYWISFSGRAGGTINRAVTRAGGLGRPARPGIRKERRKMAGITTTIDRTNNQRTPMEVFELTYTRIMVDHAEYPIATFLHMIVRADAAEHRGFPQVRPSLIAQISENNKKCFS